MKKKNDDIEERPEGWEPSWMNPENDRKTPYTEEELKQFAEGFIESMSDTKALQDLQNDVGSENLVKVIKEQFREQDERNPENFSTETQKH